MYTHTCISLSLYIYIYSERDIAAQNVDSNSANMSHRVFEPTSLDPSFRIKQPTHIQL